MKSKDWIFLPLGLVLAVAASAVTGMVSTAKSNTASAAESSASAAAAQQLASLSESVDDLRRQQSDLRAELQQLQTGGPSRREEIGGLDGAVARWMQQNAPGLAGVESAGESVAPPGADADASIEIAVDRILVGIGSDSIAFWQDLRENGKLDAVIESLQVIAEASPHDPDIQVALAGAFVQKVFEVGPGALQARFNEAADGAYDRALELEDDNWDARFGKAIALSNWPSFQGKSGESMHNFEILVEQQEARPTEDRYAVTYFVLGNLYRENGEPEKALAMWSRGAQIFPGDANLAQQIAGLSQE